MIRWALVGIALALPALAQEVVPITDAAPDRSPPPVSRPDPEARVEVFVPTDETDTEQTGTPIHETLRESPDELAACLSALDGFGTVYKKVPAITGELRDCGIANPLEVSEILPGVALQPDAVMRCGTALALAEWVSGTVAPAARLAGTLSELAAVDHGSTYVCRRRGGGSSAKISEHGFGNAIDVTGFRFRNGETLAIEPRADSGTIEEAFQRAARGGACLSFTTVLGPGTDAAHADHLHLDIKDRNGGYRICQ